MRGKYCSPPRAQPRPWREGSFQRAWLIWEEAVSPRPGRNKEEIPSWSLVNPGPAGLSPPSISPANRGKWSFPGQSSTEPCPPWGGGSSRPCPTPRCVARAILPEAGLRALLHLALLAGIRPGLRSPCGTVPAACLISHCPAGSLWKLHMERSQQMLWQHGWGFPL